MVEKEMNCVIAFNEKKKLNIYMLFRRLIEAENMDDDNLFLFF